MTSCEENTASIRSTHTESERKESARWVIENLDRPGRFWNPRKKSFKSELSGDWKGYFTEAQAKRASIASGVRGRGRVRMWLPVSKWVDVDLSFERRGRAIIRVDAITEADAVTQAQQILRDEPERIEWEESRPLTNTCEEVLS